MIDFLITEVTLYITAALLSITSIWALIELTKEKSYRWTLWGITPVAIVSIFLMVMSVTTLKGMPTEKLPEAEFFVINYVAVKDRAIYLWVVENGKHEPLSLKLPYVKEDEKNLKDGAERSKKNGRPMKGLFKAFGNEKQKGLRLWEFDVESTLPNKNEKQAPRERPAHLRPVPNVTPPSAQPGPSEGGMEF